jgi:hypothetical protein
MAIDKELTEKQLMMLEKLYDRCGAEVSRAVKIYRKSKNPLHRKRLNRHLNNAAKIGHKVLDIMDEVRKY